MPVDRKLFGLSREEWRRLQRLPATHRAAVAAQVEERVRGRREANATALREMADLVDGGQLVGGPDEAAVLRDAAVVVEGLAVAPDFLRASG